MLAEVGVGFDRGARAVADSGRVVDNPGAAFATFTTARPKGLCAGGGPRELSVVASSMACPARQVGASFAQGRRIAINPRQGLARMREAFVRRARDRTREPSVELGRKWIRDAEFARPRAGQAQRIHAISLNTTASSRSACQ